MRFKILNDSKVFSELKDLFKRMQHAHTEARKLAIKIGAKQWRQAKGDSAGGLSAFRFKKMPKDMSLWRYVARTNKTEIFPRNVKENKEILAKINALPIVERRNAINKIIGFEPQFIEDEGQPLFRQGVGYVDGKTIILIDVGEGSKYKPKPGMVEITETEYRKYANKAEAERLAVK